MATKANINRNCGTGNDVKNATAREFFRETCGKCGATCIDSQIGLEETPDAYVAEMVALFREVWRVLADDGTLWLNLGDSYVADSYVRERGTQAFQSGADTANEGWLAADRAESGKARKNLSWASSAGLKKKDLIGIPWRVALALQADGWYLRSDIIWAKPNPMPESVTDRPTKSHEYLFLLTKSPRYYYDHEAIKEPALHPKMKHKSNKKPEGASVAYIGNPPTNLGRAGTSDNGLRNKRDVWTINTKPFKGAHFAVMPEALVEPCVLAGSAEGDTVLDPFTGSGTVAVVANRHGRNFVGTELNADYAEIARERITKDAPMLNKVETK